MAHRAARDWLVAARDVAAAFGAAAIARRSTRRRRRRRRHFGGHRGADPEVGIDVNYGDRTIGRAANAADAARRKDPRALLEALDGPSKPSVARRRRRRRRRRRDFGGHRSRGGRPRMSERRLGRPAVRFVQRRARGGEAHRLCAGGYVPGRGAHRTAAGSRRWGRRRYLGGGVSNDVSSTGANAHPVWNFPDLASYVDPDAPHAVLSLKPLLRLWGVFKATGNGDAFAAQMRRERASQLAADLDLGASENQSPTDDAARTPSTRSSPSSSGSSSSTSAWRGRPKTRWRPDGRTARCVRERATTWGCT